MILARHLRDRGGFYLAVAAHKDETDPDLAGMADDLCWVRLGQFKRILDFLQRQRIQEVVLAGGIQKVRIWRIRPDALALRLAARLLHKHDDHLLRAIAAELESRGMRVRSASDFVPELLAPEGCLSRRVPTTEEWLDIRFGWKMAKELGRLDIGQGVVVRDQVVVAVEAVEGTDAMIQRAGSLCGGRGALVKVCKPQQDHRLDMPAIGPRTIENLHRAGIPVLAIEAGRTMILELEETLRRAEGLGISLVACSETSMGKEEG